MAGRNNDKYISAFLKIAICLYCFIALYSITQCWYSGDDRNSTLSFAVRYFQNQKFTPYYLNIIKQVLESGRLQIVSIIFGMIIEKLPLFYYRIYLIISIIINVLLFGTLMYHFTKSRKIQYLSMLFITLMFQIFTNYHNCFITFGGMIQWLFSFLLITFILLSKYCETDKKRYLVLSLLLFLLALTTYELAYVFLPLIIIFIFYFKKDLKKTFYIMLPYVIVFSILIFASFNLRKNINLSNTDVAFSFNLNNLISAFVKQFTAAFPLSNLILVYHNSHGLYEKIKLLVKSIQMIDIFQLFMFVGIIYLIDVFFLDHKKIGDKNIILLFIFGLSIIAGTSAIVALSSRYQVEIGWGTGYIPVYIEYFGAIVLLYALLEFVFNFLSKSKHHKMIGRIIKYVIVVVSLPIILLNQTYARSAIAAYNNLVKYQMESMEDALKSGIISDVEDNGTIINCTTITTYLDDNTYSKLFFLNYSRVVRNVEYMSDYSKSLMNQYKNKNTETVVFAPSTPTYIIRSFGTKAFEGGVMGKIESITLDMKNQMISKINVSSVKVFYNNKNNPLFSGISLSSFNDKQNTYSMKYVPMSDMSPANNGDEVICNYSKINMIDFNSIQFTAQ